MNYIGLINRLWQADKESRVPIYDKVLYFFLLDTCNALGWRMPFGHSDRYLSTVLGISVNTVRAAKQRLYERELIEFEVPQKASKGVEGQTRFWFPTVSPHDTVIRRKDKSTVSPDDTDKKPTVSLHDTVNTSTVSPTVSGTVSPGDTNNKLNINTNNTQGVVADAPTPKKQKTKKAKKEDSALFTACMEIYHKWFVTSNDGITPKIDGAQGKALKSIIRELRKQVIGKNEYNKEHNVKAYIADMSEEVIASKIIDSWNTIFHNWHYVSDWQKKNTRLSDINSQLQNITTEIRNGISKKKSGPTGTGRNATNDHAGKQKDGITALQSLKRNRVSNPDEPVEDGEAVTVE